jgi:hypothetical protein
MSVVLTFDTPITTSDNSGGGSASYSVSPPSGIASGDGWGIIVIADDNDTSTTITKPDASWTDIASQIWGYDGWPGLKAFGKVAGSSESSVNVTIGGGSYVAWIVSFKAVGSDPAGWIGAAATGTAGSTTTPRTLTAPGITVTRDNSVVVLVHASEGDAAYDGAGPYTISMPGTSTSAVTQRSGNAEFPACAVAYEARNSGAYTPGNWTQAGAATDTWSAIALTFEVMAPASGGPTELPSLAMPPMHSLGRR